MFVKKYSILLLLAILVKTGLAQTDSTLLYLRFPFVPAFKLTNVADSSLFTKDNLKKKKAVIIIIFSPDCEHCQAETKELTEKISLFKKAQIIMVSPLNYDYLHKFYDEYKISNYPSITIGRDPTYLLGTFYNVRSFPSIFVYNKKGKLVNHFTGSTPVEKIAASL
jgi:thioredoxin-related protein